MGLWCIQFIFQGRGGQQTEQIEEKEDEIKG